MREVEIEEMEVQKQFKDGLKYQETLSQKGGKKYSIVCFFKSKLISKRCTYRIVRYFT